MIQTGGARFARWRTTCGMMVGMPSQHAHKSHGFRPDPGDFAAAEASLKQRGRTVGAYLKACLKWCAEDPDAAIAAVDSRWPSIRPPGWPHVTSPAPGPQAPTPRTRARRSRRSADGRRVIRLPVPALAAAGRPRSYRQRRCGQRPSPQRRCSRCRLLQASWDRFRHGGCRKRIFRPRAAQPKRPFAPLGFCQPPVPGLPLRRRFRWRAGDNAGTGDGTSSP